MEEQKPVDPAADFDLGSSSESSDDLDMDKQNRQAANMDDTPTPFNERPRRKRSGSAQGSEENNNDYMAGRHHHREPHKEGSENGDDKNEKRGSYRDNDYGNNRRGGRYRSRSNSAGSQGENQGRYNNRRGGDYQGSYRTRDNYQNNNNYGGKSNYNNQTNSLESLVKPDLTKPYMNFTQYKALQIRSKDGERDNGFKGQNGKVLGDGFAQYEADFQKESDKTFLEKHMTDPWFLEQYEPNTVFQMKQEEFARAQKLAKTFIDQIPVLSINLTNAETSEQYRFNANLNTICLYKIPVSVARAEMIETINSTITGTPFVQGSFSVIENLTFSEPLKLYNYVRYAYITFISEEIFQKALEVLNGVYIKDYMLAPSACNTPYKQSKLTPPLPEHQIKLDLFNCKRLIKEVFDIEKNVSNNIVAHAEKAGGSVESQLDFLILYLRRVHGYCFYSGERCSDERSLTTKSAPLYLRQNLPATVNYNEFDNLSMYSESKEFILKYEAQAKDLLKNGPIKMKNDLDAWLEKCKDDFCDNNTIMVKEGVYQCSVCDKKFQTKEFVRKHIINKHNDKFQSVELESSVWKEHQAKENFRNDPNRITLIPKKPIMQPKKDFQKQGSFGGRDWQDNGGQRGGFNGRGRGRGGRGGYRNNDRDEEGDRPMNYFNSNDNDEYGRNKNGGDRDNKAYVDLDDPTLGDTNAQPSATMIGAIGGSFSKKATEVAFDDLF